MEAKPRITPYSPQELQEALDSLVDTSIENDGAHIFGYGSPNHELSTLQTITGTVLLDDCATQADPQSPSLEQLVQQATQFAAQHGPILNLQEAIQQTAPRMALAAEFKRASPSKGAIAMHVKAADQGTTYAQAGADIISVLTEPRWFQGSLQDLTDIRLATTFNSSNDNDKRPVLLRKDFVVSEYMIAQAAAAGADTVLLIVAVLPATLLKSLIKYCRTQFGMEPLVEVHADEELQVALQAGAKVIGVNNRNLHTFQMDLSTSERVAERLQKAGHAFDARQSSTTTVLPDYTLCALSGMSNAADVDRYRQVGVAMCLIGESLMRATDPAAAISSLCLHPNDFQGNTAQSTSSGGGGAYTAGTQLIKVCGMTRAADALVACQAGAHLIGVIFAPKSKRCVTPAQAKEVVAAVRQFGERSSRLDVRLPDNKSGSAVSYLSAAAQSVSAATRRPLVVGVFQNQDMDFIRQMVQECGLDMVQLHGQEGMEAASQTGVPTIRVVDILVDPDTGKASVEAVEQILAAVTTDPVAILLDTAIKGSGSGGGTGQAFDWTIAQRVQDSGLPVIIAGGLTAESVQECVGSVRPFGVDVSSGVEESPGVKDHDKVRAFVQGARQAAVEASKGF